MFFQGDRIDAVREMIVAADKAGRERALAKILPMQKKDFTGIFRVMDGLPVTIRTLDPPLHEFLPHTEKEIAVLAQKTGVSPETITAKIQLLHEENPMRGGRAYSREDAQLLLGWAKELNCNFLRLAHYPHSENMAQVADELGLLLWEEIPVYWTIQWENAATLQNARQQLNDLIVRDHNRASVIIWSVANETPPGEARTNFLRQLVTDARALDGSRLVSAAMEVRTAADNPHRKIVDDPLGEYTDILSFNEYVGWYDGTPESIPLVEWALKYDKPVVITEFGADALQGFHADNLTRFSEEYQSDVYRKTVPMLRKIPHLRGLSPWILCDFRSPRRLLPNVQDGWNRKGLIGENGVKKEAFSVLAGFYAEIRDQGYVKK